MFISFFILVITSAVYWPGLKGPFFLDDLQSIEPAQLTTFSWKKFVEVTLQNDTGPLGRPIAVASFALNSYFWGADPFSFKIVNLFFHLITGIALAFFIYQLILIQPTIKRFAIPIALLTSFIWLIHPLQVSTVLYPVQRMTQLCAFFTLLGLNSYLWGRIRQITQKKYAWILIGLSLCLFYPLAILSKENGAIFPWYLLSIEYFFLRFKAPKLKEQLFLKHFLFILSLMVLLAGLLYYWYQLPPFLNLFAEKNMTLLERILTETKVLVFYIRLILFPQLSQMGLYHDDFLLSTHLDSSVMMSSILLLSCGLIIFLLRRKAPMIAFGLSWFFISHVIESTILPLELVFEHRNYLAQIGLILILTYYFMIYSEKLELKSKIINYTGIVFILGLLLLLTTLQSITWSSTENFLKSANLFHPNSPRVHIEIANLLLTKGKYEDAFRELNMAQNLQPFNAGISLHKILIHCHFVKMPAQFYEEAAKKLKQGAITPYVILVLDKIVDNMFNKNCNAIDKKKIIELIEIAIHNPYIGYKPLYVAVLYHLEAGVKLLEHDLQNTLILLNKSFETYPKRLDPLIQKTYLEMQNGLYQDAQNTLNKIRHAQTLRSPQDKINMLEKTFNHLNDTQNLRK